MVWEFDTCLHCVTYRPVKAVNLSVSTKCSLMPLSPTIQMTIFLITVITAQFCTWVFSKDYIFTCDWLLSLSALVLHVLIPFSWLSNIQLHAYTTVCLFSLALIEIGLLLRFWLLWIFLYKYLLVGLFSTLSATYLVEFLAYMRTQCLTSWGPANYFPLSPYFTYSQSMNVIFNVSTSYPIPVPFFFFFF